MRNRFLRAVWCVWQGMLCLIETLTFGWELAALLCEHCKTSQWRSLCFKTPLRIFARQPKSVELKTSGLFLFFPWSVACLSFPTNMFVVPHYANNNLSGSSGSKSHCWITNHYLYKGFEYSLLFWFFFLSYLLTYKLKTWYTNQVVKQARKFPVCPV